MKKKGDHQKLKEICEKKSKSFIALQILVISGSLWWDEIRLNTYELLMWLIRIVISYFQRVRRIC